MANSKPALELATKLNPPLFIQSSRALYTVNMQRIFTKFIAMAVGK